MEYFVVINFCSPNSAGGTVPPTSPGSGKRLRFYPSKSSRGNSAGNCKSRKDSCRKPTDGLILGTNVGCPNATVSNEPTLTRTLASPSSNLSLASTHGTNLRELHLNAKSTNGCITTNGACSITALVLQMSENPGEH